MRSFLNLILLISGTILLAGCIETKQEITLNPDGSGKVVYKTVRPLENFNITMQDDANKKPSTEEKAEKEVKSILENSEGVDTWEDVTYKVNDLGKLEFSGTAYFKALNDVKIGGTIKSGNNIKVETGNNILTVNWTGKFNKKPQTDLGKGPGELSEEQINKQILINQNKLRQIEGMMSAMLTGLKDETILHLPGKITEINNMKQVNDNTAALVIDGEKILKIMKDFSNDKQAMRQAIENGDNIKQGPPDSFISKKLFGNDGDVMVKVTGTMEPQFDYQEKVVAAKKAYLEMCRKLWKEVELKAPLDIPKKVEGNVKGKIFGQPFDLEKAFVQNNILHLRTGKDFFADQEFIIFLFMEKGEKLEGKKFNITEKSGYSSPHIHVKYMDNAQKRRVEIFMKDYVMQLEFKNQQDRTVDGAINLVVPAKEETAISGNFIAEIKE